MSLLPLTITIKLNSTTRRAYFPGETVSGQVVVLKNNELEKFKGFNFKVYSYYREKKIPT